MRYILLLLLAVQLQGCVMQTRHVDNGGIPTYDGVSDTYPGDAQSLATMAAEELARRYPPGRTTLTLAKTKSTFGQELDTTLRAQGFLISAPDSPAGIRVGYTLDVIRDETSPTCYLQVRTSDGESFGTVRPLTIASLSHRIDAPSVKSPTFSPLESLPLLGEPTVATPSQVQVHPDRLMKGTGPGAKPGSVPPTVPAHDAGVPVRSKSTSARIAKRNKIPVEEFCRLNNLKPDTVLEAGRMVFLRGSVAEPVFPATAQAVPPASSGDRQPKPLASAKPTPATNPVALSAPVSAPAPVAKPTEASPAATRPMDPTPVSAGNSVPTSAPAVPVAPASPVQEALAELAPPPGGSDAAPSAGPVPSWIIEPGSLHAQLESWVIKAQYQLVWKAKHDFELEARAKFDGDFVGAIKQLFAGLHRGGNPLRVTVYQGNNVVEVAED
ncbi:MAG: TcpQ domain-containing protein [Desulfovibrio sp.]|nr:TcpQ domain-containing protein [Desulfovibrio sp.]